MSGAAAAARSMPQTQLIVHGDREGDLYELHQAAPDGRPISRVGARANDRNLASHEQLWRYASLPPGARRKLQVAPAAGPTEPARGGGSALGAGRDRAARSGVQEELGAVKLWAIWVHEPDPPGGSKPSTGCCRATCPSTTGRSVGRVQWYCRRWIIEDGHRVLKSG
jgi:hypothetical protein